MFCECCGKPSPLSARGLCRVCQKVKGALQRRVYDCRTGKRRAQSDVAVAPG